MNCTEPDCTYLADDADELVLHLQAHMRGWKDAVAEAEETADRVTRATSALSDLLTEITVRLQGFPHTFDPEMEVWK